MGICENILKELEKEKGTTKEELALKLGTSVSLISESLELLEKQYLIHMDRGKHYHLSQEKIKIGKVVTVSGDFFVRVNGKYIPIGRSHLKRAKEGDSVIARVRNIDSPVMDAIVEEVISTELGEVIEKNGKYCIKNGTKFPFLEFVIEGYADVLPGLLINFSYGKEIEPYVYSVHVLKKVGHINHPGSHFQKLISPSGIETKFPSEVMQEAAKLPRKVKEEDLIGRADFRSDSIFTIDGEGSKDFDDAVSIEVLENGNYLLGVHIADVDHYVKEESLIDKEAYLRSSSVYLMDQVVPMLPYKLSNGICSLNEGVDRLTVSCKMEINPFGEVMDANVYKSVICSKKRMKYHEVNEILKKGNMIEGYEPFLKDLENMWKLSNLLHEKRKERGSIEFDVPELKFSFENGHPKEIHTRKRGLSEHIIEEFMLLANTTVAKLLKGYPVPRRVNPKPDIKILKKANMLIFSMVEHGKIPRETFEIIKPILEEISHAKEDTFIEPKKIQLLLDHLRDYDDNAFTLNFVLSAMKRAYYSIADDMHYALALSDYTHFTSPIRRYPDLMVHRSIKRFLLRPSYDYDKMKLLEQRSKEMVKYISEKEKRIQKCERMIDSMNQVEYMRDHIGEIYQGYIEQITKHGLQICFQDGMLGKVKLSSLEDYQYDGKTRTLIHPTKEAYHIGDMIEVLVSEVDYDHFHIYLEPVKEKAKVLKR